MQIAKPHPKLYSLDNSEELPWIDPRGLTAEGEGCLMKMRLFLAVYPTNIMKKQ